MEFGRTLWSGKSTSKTINGIWAHSLVGSTPDGDPNEGMHLLLWSGAGGQSDLDNTLFWALAAGRRRLLIPPRSTIVPLHWTKVDGDTWMSTTLPLWLRIVKSKTLRKLLSYSLVEVDINLNAAFF